MAGFAGIIGKSITQIVLKMITRVPCVSVRPRRLTYIFASSWHCELYVAMKNICTSKLNLCGLPFSRYKTNGQMACSAYNAASCREGRIINDVNRVSL